MTDIDDYEDDTYDPGDDWYDDERDGIVDYEPDGEDYEIARSYAEHYEHCERRHGGGECNCRPSLLLLAYGAVARKLQSAWWQARSLPWRLREPRTVRIGPAEITLRFKPRDCMACRGKGWFYTKTGIDPDPMPEGYDGVGLCGCGASITRLAEDRRIVRQAQKEPPF
jgi:hypothetical protein